MLLGNVLAGGVHDVRDYGARGGIGGWRRAQSLTAENLIAEIDASGLRGRGGAGFPAGRKWRAVARAADPDRRIVANADEGDPGTFSDRVLMEDDPFALIEGMAIAARAIGARRGVIYLRKEYPRAAQRLSAAIGAAHENGTFGDFTVELVIGEGGYIAGEETALIEALEGHRPEPRVRPPYLFEHGLQGHPVLVHNVETLCAVPWILRHGAQAYARLGLPDSAGTKLLSLTSTLRMPGLYEVPFGITLREIVEDLGGGLVHGPLRALMVGGPLAGLIPPALLDTRLGYTELQAIGAAVGHGGVIAFGEDTSIAQIAQEVFRFGAYESCGKCTPCRLGSPVIEAAFGAAVAHGRSALGYTRYGELLDALEMASLCGHGRGLAEFARSLERHFPEALRACLA